MQKISQKQITAFFDQKNIAFIGISRNASDFSRVVYKEFVNRNYNIIPVNPNASEIDGKNCYASIDDVQSPVDAAFIFVPSSAGDISKKCIDKGIKNIWIYNGKQENTDNFITGVADSSGINIISGYCPMMFIPGTGWFHKMHGFFTKLSGKYPA
jgi:predicted CoA-binding protein